jgi:hypothetical protein
MQRWSLTRMVVGDTRLCSDLRRCLFFIIILRTSTDSILHIYKFATRGGFTVLCYRSNGLNSYIRSFLRSESETEEWPSRGERKPVRGHTTRTNREAALPYQYVHDTHFENMTIHALPHRTNTIATGQTGPPPFSTISNGDYNPRHAEPGPAPRWVWRHGSHARCSTPVRPWGVLVTEMFRTRKKDGKGSLKRLHLSRKLARVLTC